jgi:hypothetical protein
MYLHTKTIEKNLYEKTTNLMYLHTKTIEKNLYEKTTNLMYLCTKPTSTEKKLPVFEKTISIEIQQI